MPSFVTLHKSLGNDLTSSLSLVNQSANSVRVDYLFAFLIRSLLCFAPCTSPYHTVPFFLCFFVSVSASILRYLATRYVFIFVRPDQMHFAFKLQIDYHHNVLNPPTLSVYWSEKETMSNHHDDEALFPLEMGEHRYPLVDAQGILNDQEASALIDNDDDNRFIDNDTGADPLQTR